jgi:transposase
MLTDYMFNVNTTNLMETLYFLGIDISKKKFDAALTIDGKNFHEVQIENQAKPIESFFRELKRQLSSLSKLIVCLEHTGIYCQPLLDYLVKNQIRVCVEPALQIKQSQGMTRGKNDRIDAKRIALYALKNRENLAFWKPQRHCIQKLKALLTTRERLVKIRVQLEVPLRECEEFIEPSIRKEMVRHCHKTLNSVQGDIDKIEQAIEQLVKEDSQLREQCALATSVPGIGKITALNMIVSTSEFTRIAEAKKFACYAGVAPFEHISGSSIRGKTRVSKMANMTLKKLLHLAAMSAIQCCEELKAFYQRKVAAGKNKMSVINAVRNKLISRVFACIKNNRKYQKIYQHALV